MSNLVNLNKARKAKLCEEGPQRANQNAAKHGLTKSEKVLQATKSHKAAKMLDQHELDPEA